MLTPLQSLLFAAGLRPTPAQATAVSWVSFYCVGQLWISGLDCILVKNSLFLLLAFRF